MRLPRLHLVTDDTVVARPEFVHRATEAAEAGGADVAIHLRSPAAGGRSLYELAVELRWVTDRTGTRLLINDRADVAAAVGADGIQLGMRSLAPADARRCFGRPGLLGVSVHSPVDARGLQEANFLLAGTIYPSASHPGRPGAGPGWVRELAAHRLPVIAIGGMEPRRVPEVMSAGAHGVAVIRAVWAATAPGKQVRAFLGAIQRHEPD